MSAAPRAAQATARAFSPALLTDLYELTMLQAYFEEGMQARAVFSLFSRRLPPSRNYLLTCGLDDVLAFLETLRFDEAAIEYLRSLGRFSDAFLRSLATFRFTGDVWAVPEGTPVFAGEPLLRPPQRWNASAPSSTRALRKHEPSAPSRRSFSAGSGPTGRSRPMGGGCA